MDTEYCKHGQCTNSSQHELQRGSQLCPLSIDGNFCSFLNGLTGRSDPVGASGLDHCDSYINFFFIYGDKFEFAFGLQQHTKTEIWLSTHPSLSLACSLLCPWAVTCPCN